MMSAWLTRDIVARPTGVSPDHGRCQACGEWVERLHFCPQVHCCGAARCEACHKLHPCAAAEREVGH